MAAGPPCFVTFTLCLQLGSTAVGVKTDHGVVLAVEKRITSKLLVRSSCLRILTADV